MYQTNTGIYIKQRFCLKSLKLPKPLSNKITQRCYNLLKWKKKFSSGIHTIIPYVFTRFYKKKLYTLASLITNYMIVTIRTTTSSKLSRIEIVLHTVWLIFCSIYLLQIKLLFRSICRIHIFKYPDIIIANSQLKCVWQVIIPNDSFMRTFVWAQGFSTNC